MVATPIDDRVAAHVLVVVPAGTELGTVTHLVDDELRRLAAHLEGGGRTPRPKAAKPARPASPESTDGPPTLTEALPTLDAPVPTEVDAP